MRISELASQTGVSIRSLRYYEQKKLITPIRLENAYRDYNESAIEQVRLIQFYLGLGLNTDEIGQLFKCKVQPGQEISSEHTCTTGIILIYTQEVRAIDEEMHSLATIKARLLDRMSWLEEHSMQPVQKQQV
jgi:DNA-binding transcriptional MerR regulator